MRNRPNLSGDYAQKGFFNLPLRSQESKSFTEYCSGLAEFEVAKL